MTTKTTVRPTVSIALCTHNGAEFLAQQLDSIAAQTWQPDELIVSDDASTDATLDIVRTFAHQAGFQVFINQNNPGLRTVKNFEKAVSLCANDYIFLCDQDDYWRPTKIEKMVDFMQQRPNLVVGFCNALLVNDKRQSLEQQQLDMVRLRQPQREQWNNGGAFDLLLEGNRLTGCTAVMTRAFVRQIMPFPDGIPTLIHDGWIALVAAATNQIGFTEEILMEYRQHDAQQIGSKFADNGPATTLDKRFARGREEKIAPIAQKKQFYEAINQEIKKVLEHNTPNIQKIGRKINHLNARIKLPAEKHKRVVPVLKELMAGNYKKYTDQDANFYGPFLTAFGDLFEP